MPLQKAKYRFFLTGGLPTGLITVHFAANTWNTTPATGYSNLASDKTFTVLGPTADLVNPSDGSSTGAANLNNRGFIDVPIVVVGNTLDESTVTDLDPEFSIDSGPATTNLSLDDKQAPLLLSSSLNGNTTTYTYRYWTIGSVPDTTTGLTLHFLSGGFAFSDGQTSTSTDATAPVNFSAAGGPTPNIGYLDVRLTPTSGDTLDTGSLSGNELTFAGNGKGTAAPTTTVAPTQLTGTAVYRFYVTGSFAIGPLGVTFVDGSFTSASGP